ncbi:hypothetical protein L1987_61211 [Smallanthus sonchifolius]|uniref:Uncharacterized protein n=1 Tax=Smallanthus sonchifolius TaxID=185202 RepID=A0ACB9DB27_9ASTR|nr:hypothetical protein L1987_61211 [Smallanthus sonchifolius]
MNVLACLYLSCEYQIGLKEHNACVGEVKSNKANESVCLYINIDDKKLVLGTLNSERLPQQLFDLVFDKDFQLSHNWKNGNSDEEEEAPLPISNVKIVEPAKDDSDSDEDDSMSEDTDEDNEDSSDNEDDSEEEEETPKKQQQSGKKRPNESAIKTPVNEKKAKLSTPQKTDGKKAGGHVATPHPSKQGKTPANKSNQESPASASAAAGAYSCKPCNRYGSSISQPGQAQVNLVWKDEMVADFVEE